MPWLDMDRRRLGTIMVGFGALGVVLAGAAAVALLAGGIAAAGLGGQIANAQDRIGRSMTGLETTMDRVASTTDNASSTLATSRDGMTQAVTVLGDVAASSDSLASALDVSIFGERPFTSAVGQLRDLRTQVLGFQDDATKLATSLGQNASDATQVAAQVRAMRSQVADAAQALDGLTGAQQSSGLLALGAVLAAFAAAWQAVLAASIAWVGMRLRRRAAAYETGLRDLAQNAFRESGRLVHTAVHGNQDHPRRRYRHR